MNSLLKRILKITFNKGGSGSLSPRIAIPMTYLKDMGITPDEREVILEYDNINQKIIITKKSEE